MKRRWLLLALIFTLVPSVPTHAATLGRVANLGQAPSGSDDQTQESEIPYKSFTPRVTALHSVNAALAESGETVYFLPELEDFPVNLKDTAANVTDASGKSHQFAAVYDGYFNTEVLYRSANQNGNVGRLTTSKKVYDSSDNSRALNLLGYDLLLSNENCSLSVSNGNLNAEYVAKRIEPTEPLNAATCVMDLYKAVNAYEWDIQFAWCKDSSLSLASSPLQEQISVLIDNNASTKGIVTSEGATWVWATRTNPNLYWDKVVKDAVFNNGAHYATTKAKTPGTNTSVSFSKSGAEPVSLGEFCAIARAIMELYGEPTITPTEEYLMLENYAVSLPTGLPDEIIQSVRYLAAKGIIDPSDLQFSKNVTFSDIETILLRIRDKDSRLTLKETESYVPLALKKAGYVAAEVTYDNTVITSVRTISNPVENKYNDYFIATDDDITNCRIDDNELLASDFVISCNGVPVTDFKYQGITSTKYYYFKLPKDLTGTLLFSHDMNKHPGSFYYENATGAFTIPAGGGVYKNIDGKLTQLSLDEEGYTDDYLDSTRRARADLWMGDNYLSGDSYNWIEVLVGYDTESDALLEELDQTTYGDVPLVGALSEVFLNPGRDKSVYIPEVDLRIWCASKLKQPEEDNEATYACAFIFQTTEDVTSFRSKLNIPNLDLDETAVGSTAGFYHANDGTLLVGKDFLLDLGLITNVQKINEAGDYIITCPGKYIGNIYLLNNLHKVLVGSVMYDAKDEVLVQEVKGKLFLNAKVIQGWALDSLYWIDDDDKLVLNYQLDGVDMRATTIRTYNPKAGLNTGVWAKLGSVNSPLRLTSSYPLSNWLLVVGNDGSSDVEDTLFVWYHRIVTLDGTNVDLGDDTAAREKLKELTGISTDNIPNYYHLRAVIIRRDMDNTGGLYALPMNTNTEYITDTPFCGYYCYEPIEAEDYSVVAKYYDMNSVECLLPIVKQDHRFYNINMNLWQVTGEDKYLPYGCTLRSVNTQKLEDAKYLDIPKSLSEFEKSSESYDIASLRTVPAPTNLFLIALGLNTNSQVDTELLKSCSIYYGTSLCNVSTDDGFVVRLGTKALNFTSDAAYRVFTASSDNTVYSLLPEVCAVDASEQEQQSKFDVIVSVFDNTKSLIDWDEYTFSRMAEEADTFLTVVLIIILNVLPRFFILWFMVLMLMSLLVNLKFWQAFNEKVIDVYRIMTFGLRSIHTINIKELVLQCVIYMAVCYIIMDGTLFHFIIWVAKGFIYFMNH